MFQCQLGYPVTTLRCLLQLFQFCPVSQYKILHNNFIKTTI